MGNTTVKGNETSTAAYEHHEIPDGECNGRARLCTMDCLIRIRCPSVSSHFRPYTPTAKRTRPRPVDALVYKVWVYSCKNLICETRHCSPFVSVNMSTEVGGGT